MRPSLNPAWLPRAPEERWGVGLEIDCPVHAGWCRLELYFLNPVDGGLPVDRDGPLYWRDGAGLGSISLYPAVHAGEHGDFIIRRGQLVRVLH